MFFCLNQLIFLIISLVKTRNGRCAWRCLPIVIVLFIVIISIWTIDWVCTGWGRRYATAALRWQDLNLSATGARALSITFVSAHDKTLHLENSLAIPLPGNRLSVMILIAQLNLFNIWLLSIIWQYWCSCDICNWIICRNRLNLRSICCSSFSVLISAPPVVFSTCLSSTLSVSLHIRIWFRWWYLSYIEHSSANNLSLILLCWL